MDVGERRGRRCRARANFVKGRSRDAHLIVVGMPIFSAAWWKGRDFDAPTLEAPLGSGAYKVGRFEQGRFIEFARDPNYWGRDLPVNVGPNNFATLRFEYYRERQVAFEAFKAGAINFHQEYTSRTWATGYDFPAAQRRPRHQGDAAQRRAEPDAGLVFQPAPRPCSRTRAFARRSRCASTSSGPTRT